MTEQYRPPTPEEIIAYICENGPSGGWVKLEAYTKNELETIQRYIEARIELHGDQLTQQESPLDHRKLTYNEVLGKVLGRVRSALAEK